MDIEKNCALLVIDIQQEDFLDMPDDIEEAAKDSRWVCILNGKRVLDVFRKKKLPVIQIKEVHREDMVDFGRELDGSEGVHCVETSPYCDYAKLTYPIKGEYLIILIFPPAYKAVCSWRSNHFLLAYSGTAS